MPPPRPGLFAHRHLGYLDGVGLRRQPLQIVMKRDREDELLERIATKPGILCGKPIIRGMRISAEQILGMLACGMSAEEIIEAHPTLEPDDIRACLAYALQLIAKERPGRPAAEPSC